MNNNGDNGGIVELGILYIFFQIIEAGISEIPYVTLISIIGQVRILTSSAYFGIIFF